MPRTDEAGQQQHTPTAAHAVSPMPLASPTPLSPLLSPKLAKPTDPVELAAAIRKQVCRCTAASTAIMGAGAWCWPSTSCSSTR